LSIEKEKIKIFFENLLSTNFSAALDMIQSLLLLSCFIHYLASICLVFYYLFNALNFFKQKGSDPKIAISKKSILSSHPRDVY